jgi:hypothetical protein
VLITATLPASAADKRCDHCNAFGQPYTYRGRRLSGLTAYRGERLCPACTDRALQADLDEPVGWAQVPAREYVTPIAAKYRYRDWPPAS